MTRAAGYASLLPSYVLQQPAFAVCQIDGEEKHTAAGKASTIAGHIEKLPRRVVQRGHKLRAHPTLALEPQCRYLHCSGKLAEEGCVDVLFAHFFVDIAPLDERML